MQTFSTVQFLQDFTSCLPAAQNPATILASELKISVQSAYRKLKGESELTANEYFKLLDFLNRYKGKNDEQFFEFSYNSGDKAAMQLHALLQQMLTAASAKKVAHMYYVANDVSLLQLLQIPELALFKMHYLLHSVYNTQNDTTAKFNFETPETLATFNEVVQQLVTKYLQVSETTIIGPHAFQHLLYQIQYYFQAGFIESKEVALILIQKVDELLNHLFKQAQLQHKFLPNQAPNETSFQLYFNKLMNVNNVALLDAAPVQHSIIITYGLNFLHSTDSEFYAKQLQWISNLKHKSQLISGGSERDQLVFKNQLHQQIRAVEAIIQKENTWF